MNELSLVRLKIQELKKELLELEMEERRLVQEEMGNKIIVEFDRKKIEKNCNRYFCLDCEKHCGQTDKDLIRCYLNWNDFKIKEQNNGK